MKKAFLITLLSLSCLCLKAQINLDSLYSIWQDETQSDSTRTNSYKDYIRYGFVYSNPDSAFVLAQNLIAYGEQHHYPPSVANGYNVQGLIGLHKGNYPNALFYFQKSLKIFEEIGDAQGVNKVIANMGNIYRIQKNYPRAKEYYLRALNQSGGFSYPPNIARIQLHLGVVYKAEGNNALAMENFLKSAKTFEEHGEKVDLTNTLAIIAMILSDEGKYESALEYIDRAIEIRKQMNDQYGLAFDFAGKGRFQNKQGNYSLALENCKRAMTLAKEGQFLSIEAGACKCMYDSYKGLGQGAQALTYLEQWNNLQDSLQKDETKEMLQQMEFAKQVLADSLATVEEKRLVEEAHQEEMRQKNRTRNILLGVGLLLLILAGGIYSRLRYIRKSKAIIEKEKDRSDNLLLNILPAEIAQELKEKGEATARDFDMVSILFTDFKEFTQTSEKRSAQELVSEVNACFEAFDGIMGKYGIEKIKTIGDAYMAAGGLPVPSDDSVKNTVLAALEMQSFISQRKAAMDAAGKPAFEMRVGIHSGPVVAGIVGVKKFQYDIWGDTVNTASRMESAGAVGQVNISQATYELLQEDPAFTFDSRGKIEAKGKGEMEMWFVDRSLGGG